MTKHSQPEGMQKNDDVESNEKLVAVPKQIVVTAPENSESTPSTNQIKVLNKIVVS